jgi:hypothetical protein
VVSYETWNTNEKVFPIHTSSILHGVLGGCPFTLAAGFQFMGIIKFIIIIIIIITKLYIIL